MTSQLFRTQNFCKKMLNQRELLHSCFYEVYRKRKILNRKMYSFTRYEYSNVNGEENVTVETSDKPPAGYRSGRISALPDGFDHLGNNYIREYRNTAGDGNTRTVTFTSNRPDSRPGSSLFNNGNNFGDGSSRDFEDEFNKMFNKRSIFWENDSNLRDDRFAGFSNNFGSNRSPSRSIGPEKTEVTNDVKEIIKDSSVAHHNHYRRLHQDTNPLNWDENLAEGAHKWAETLAENKALRHSNENNVGENLYMFSTSEDIDFDKACQTAVQSWYSEIKNYDLKTHWQAGTVGHFTQVVWKSTEKLGVGVCKIRENGMTNVYVVGRYSPPGNFMGKYKQNVNPLK